MLFVEGASTQFNSTLDPAMIERARAEDPEASEAEWLGGFRQDIAAFLDDEVIERVVDYSRPLEIPPRQGISYSAFVDPSGGRHDAFCGCHCAQGGRRRRCVPCLRCFAAAGIRRSTRQVVSEYAALLKEYKIHTVTGDNYSAESVSAAFTKAGY